MPLYHFDVHDGVNTIDPTVETLPDVQAARARAIGLLADVLRWSPASLWAGDDVRIEVRDADRLLLFQLFAFASVCPAGRQMGL
jgi:hypothetical protein